MVIKYVENDPRAPMQGIAYELDERESALFRQYQIATLGGTNIPRETFLSTVIASPGKDALIEKMLTLAGLNITEDRTKDQ